MATNWILSRRRYSLAGRGRRHRRLLRRRAAAEGAGERDQSARVAVLGAGTMGAQIAAHLANAGVPVLLLDVTADAARDGLERARALKPDPFFTARRARRSFAPAASTTDLDASRGARTGSSRPSSNGSTSSRRCSSASTRSARPRRDRQLQHVGHSDRRDRRGPIATASGRTALGTHFFNPPRYLRLLEVIPTADDRSRGRRRSAPRLPITASARASSSRRTRRTSSPITSACTA